MSSLFLHLRVTVFEEKSSYYLERVNQKVSDLEVTKHNLSLGYYNKITGLRKILQFSYLTGSQATFLVKRP